MRDEGVASSARARPDTRRSPVGIGRDGGAHLRDQAFRLGAVGRRRSGAARCRTSARPAASRRCGRAFPSRPCRSGCSGRRPSPSRRPRNGARRCPASGRCGRRRWRRSPAGESAARGRSFALDQSAEPQFGATSSRIVHQRACEASGRRNRPPNRIRTKRRARRTRSIVARRWEPRTAETRPAALHEGFTRRGETALPPPRSAATEARRCRIVPTR